MASNLSLFEKIVDRNADGAIIFNVDGKYGWTNKQIFSWDDNCLKNYFGEYALEKLVLEGSSHNLYTGPGKNVIIDPNTFSSDKFKDVPDEVLQNIRELSKPEIFPFITAKFEGANAVGLKLKEENEFVFLNEIYYSYMANRNKYCRAFLSNFRNIPVVCFTSAEKDFYGMVAPFDPKYQNTSLFKAILELSSD